VRGRFERTLRRVAAELERGPLPAAAADSTPTPALRARGRGVTQPA
jgi:hypothetical protein